MQRCIFMVLGMNFMDTGNIPPVKAPKLNKIP